MQVKEVGTVQMHKKKFQNGDKHQEELYMVAMVDSLHSSHMVRN